MATDTFGLHARHAFDEPHPSWADDSQTTRPTSTYEYHALWFDETTSPSQTSLSVQALPPCPVLGSISLAHQSGIEPSHLGSKPDVQSVCDDLSSKWSICPLDNRLEDPVQFEEASRAALEVYNTELDGDNLR